MRLIVRDRHGHAQHQRDAYSDNEKKELAHGIPVQAPGTG
jgi:hypothetical protein